jgi:hypothetical protein
VTVSVEQTLRRKITTGDQEPVGVIERRVDRWKWRARAKPGDHTVIVPALPACNKGGSFADATPRAR